MGRLSGFGLVFVAAAVLVVGPQRTASAAGTTAEQASKVINWRDLIPLLPKPPEGWSGDKPKGQTNRVGNFVSTVVSVRFTKGDATVRLTISDYGSASFVTAGIESLAAFEEDTEEGYTRGVRLSGGLKGSEEYRYDDKRGKVLLGFKKRLLIEASGDNIDGTKVLLDLVKKIDTKRLSELIGKHS